MKVCRKSGTEKSSYLRGRRRRNLVPPVEFIQRLSGATERARHVSLDDAWWGGAECSTSDSASACASLRQRTFMALATPEIRLVKTASIDRLIAVGIQKVGKRPADGLGAERGDGIYSPPPLHILYLHVCMQSEKYTLF